MKKRIMIMAIVFIAVAIVCFALSKWFYYQGGMVMDGPGEFYAKMGRRVSICEDLVKGFGIAGIIILIVSLFIKKRKIPKMPYDPETQYPVIRASICNGEKVAGFKNKTDGNFTEVMLIRSDVDLEEFRKAYGIDEVKTEY